MKKILFISSLMAISFFCDAQTFICWRMEDVRYNYSTQDYQPIKRYDITSEAFFGDDIIRINDVSLYLTKLRTRSRNTSRNGTVTVYDVMNSKNVLMVATVVEDVNGILKLFVTNDKSDDGVVYYIKNR